MIRIEFCKSSIAGSNFSYNPLLCGMEFEWDLDKNEANRQKHNISFEEAAEIFRYPVHELVDTRSEYGEIRYIAIGNNSQMVIITVVYTEREGRIRIISARRSNKQEKRLYYDYCT